MNPRHPLLCVVLDDASRRLVALLRGRQAQTVRKSALDEIARHGRLSFVAVAPTQCADPTPRAGLRTSGGLPYFGAAPSRPCPTSRCSCAIRAASWRDDAPSLASTAET